MHDPARDPDTGEGRAPANRELVGNPLDFIHADHLREREVCAEIDALAGAETPDAGAPARILPFLRDRLPLHLQDEEEDLFPLLRRRCAPEDEIGKAIDRLTSDHRHTDEDTPRVIAALESLVAEDGEMLPDTRARFASFAARTRRHLILEDAIVLPFARLRLTKRDLETLRLRMRQRRGLDRHPETADAE